MKKESIIFIIVVLLGIFVTLYFTNNSQVSSIRDEPFKISGDILSPAILSHELPFIF